MNRAMKDSGIPWIGEIPEGWDVKKIDNLYTLRNEKVSDKDYPPLSVTMRGILPQLETAAKTNDGDNRKLVRKGDFAINSRSDRRGSCGISDYDGSVSLINTVLCPRSNMSAPFYNWLFHTTQFADEFYKWGHGIVDDLWTTRWQEMKSIHVVAPPLSEQEAIAAFLDRKCGEVDAMVSLQEQVIEELKAYKQSVITEAVTKGLNPNAPMKPSHIDWIGQIPEHWESCAPLKWFTIIILGKMLQTNAKGSMDTLEKYICAKDVHFEGIDFSNLKQMYFSKEDKELYRIKKGDLLVVEGGAGSGGASIVNIDIENTYIQNSIMIVRPKTNEEIRFVRYALISLVSRGYIDFICNKATIPHYTKEKLSETIIPVPPLSEQRDIADYLDGKCAEIDALISLKQQKIEELREYKKSLIYEYVTGKNKFFPVRS